MRCRVDIFAEKRPMTSQAMQCSDSC